MKQKNKVFWDCLVYSHQRIPLFLFILPEQGDSRKMFHSKVFPTKVFTLLSAQVQELQFSKLSFRYFVSLCFFLFHFILEFKFIQIFNSILPNILEYFPDYFIVNDNWSVLLIKMENILVEGIIEYSCRTKNGKNKLFPTTPSKCIQRVHGEEQKSSRLSEQQFQEAAETDKQLKIQS